MKSGVTVKMTDPKDLPISLPCPNPKCSSKVDFKLGDIHAKKLVKCPSCGTNIQLNPTQ